MAKIKSSTKSDTPRKVKTAKGRGPATTPVPVSEKLEAAAAADRAPQTKQALVIGLLQRRQGASVAELAEATGWLPHTTRAALTRLRQGGHELQKETRDTGETAYRIAPSRVSRSRKAA